MTKVAFWLVVPKALDAVRMALLDVSEAAEVPIIPKSGVMTPVYEETMRPVPADELPP